jgi:predicted PurR-regulated permease PerM
MTLEIVLFIGILGMLIIISLMILSVLKGIADILDQRKDMFNKQSEWLGDIINILNRVFESENKLPLELPEDIEEDDESKNSLFEKGLEALDEKINQEKSKNL